MKFQNKFFRKENDLLKFQSSFLIKKSFYYGTQNGPFLDDFVYLLLIQSISQCRQRRKLRITSSQTRRLGAAQKVSGHDSRLELLSTLDRSFKDVLVGDFKTTVTFMLVRLRAFVTAQTYSYLFNLLFFFFSQFFFFGETCAVNNSNLYARLLALNWGCRNDRLCGHKQVDDELLLLIAWPFYCQHLSGSVN